MIGIGFLWFGAMLTLWLIAYTLLAYALPDNVVGKVAATLK